MPHYKVTAPDGATIVLTGDQPPTQADLEDIFTQRRMGHIPAVPPGPEAPTFLGTLGQELSGGASQIASQFDTNVPDSYLDRARRAIAPPPAILGALRMAAAVPTAAGKSIGMGVLDETGSPVLAGISDAITQVLSGGAQGKALGTALPAIAKRLPGAPGALRELATEEARALPIKYAPEPGETEALYNDVALHNPSIPLPKLAETADQIRETELVQSMLGTHEPELAQMAKVISSTNQGQAIPFQTIREWQSRLGERMHDAAMGNNSVLARGYKRLYGALSDDISNAPALVEDAGPAVEALTKAKYAARREAAAGELQDIIEGGISPGQQGSPVPEQARFQAMLKAFDKKVKTDPRFAGSFTKTELGDIRDTLEQFRQLRPMPPPPGVNVGSALRASRGGMAWALGHAMGIPAPYAVGGEFALEAGLTKALMSRPGRMMLRNFLKNPQLFVPGASATSGAALPAVSSVAEGIGQIRPSQSPISLQADEEQP